MTLSDIEIKNSPLSPDGIVPTSPNQKRLWVIREMDPKECYYNISFSLMLEGEIQLERFDQACNQAAQEQEAFRMEFMSSEKARIKKHINFKVIHKQFLDNDKGLSDPTKIINFLKELNDEWIDLRCAPLLRMYLIKLSPGLYIFQFVTHHIVCDASSFLVFFHEIIKHYSSDKQAIKNESLRKLNSFQYHDYLICKNFSTTEEEQLRKFTFWKQQLEQLSIHDFPLDFPINPDSQMKEIILPLDSELLDRAHKTSKSIGTTLYKLLLATYAVLLNKYTRENDFIIGVPASERKGEYLKNLVGYFIQTLPIRIKLQNNMLFKELVAQVTSTLNEAVNNQEVPLVEVLQEIKLQRDGIHDPLFKTYFNIVRFDDFEKIEFSQIKCRYCWANSGFPPNDFGFLVYDIGGKCHVSIKYDALLFKENTIKRIYHHWINIVESVVKNLDIAVPDISMLSNTEMDKLVNQWSQVCLENKEIQEKNMVEVFESRVHKTPNAISAIDKNHHYTYQELNQLSNQLCHYLKSKMDIKKGAVIAICLSHHVDLFISVLAVMKTGAAYVILDPKYPELRINDIFKNAEPLCLITSDAHIQLFTKHTINLINLTLEKEAIACYSNANPVTSIQASDPIYIVYTSGSTGKPKGVEIAHQGLVNLCHFQKSELMLDETKRVLQFSAVAFDAFSWEWASCVYSGAALVFTDAIAIGNSLENSIQEFKVTHITLPPSILHTISPDKVKTLQTVVVAGEECDGLLINRWKDKVRFINGYGPSENTVCSTFFLCRSDYPPATIGKPIPGVKTFILDDNLKPVPIGVTGELYVGGIALAIQYKNDIENTKMRFIPNPFDDGQSKLYKTGDLCQYLEDGNILFRGRSDVQIKVRGYRIEINEILFAIYKFGGIKNVEIVVLPQEEHKSIVAFVVFNKHHHQDHSIDDLFKKLKEHLKHYIPSYMIPSFFYVLDRIPLTANDKVNKNELISLAKNNLTAQQSNHIVGKVEETLAHIWRNILNVSNISLQDNFFDIGGHSLLAISLAKKIEDTFDIKFDATAIFSTPIFIDMSSCIQDNIQNNKSPDKKYFVSFGKSHQSNNLYCIHPISGNVSCYQDVSELLNHQYSLLGVPSFGLYDLSVTPDKTIPDMAARYLFEIKKHQPVGPYNLFGYSMGGIIAFEMACQLQTTGDDIERLVIVDSMLPTQLKNWMDIRNKRNLALFFLRMTLAGTDKIDKYEYLAEKISKSSHDNSLLEILKNTLVENGLLDKNIGYSELERILMITQGNYLALLNYKMEKKLSFNSTIDCILTNETQNNIKNMDFSLYSNRFITSDINLIITDGCHEDIIFKKRASKWIQRLSMIKSLKPPL